MYMETVKEPNPQEYLFKSRKKGYNLTYQSVNQLLDTIVKELKIKGNYGSHSLRKTFSYHLYINNSDNPMILPYLMKILNHSSQQITLRYIGIEKETINNLYNELNL